MCADGEPASAGRRAPVIGVMGGGDVPPPVLVLAEKVGRRIANEGWILLNGGRDAGVMRASARGASDAGGTVVGVLPGCDGSGAAPGLTVAIVTGLGDARNAVNVLSSSVVIALSGGAGTLSEIALAAKSRKPLILLGWPEGSLAEVAGPLVTRAADVDEAIVDARRFLAESAP